MGNLIRLGDGPAVESTAPTRVDAMQWLVRHNEAIQRPRHAERAMVALRAGLLQYAVEYERRFVGCRLGDDAILGDAWLAMARGYIALLNGDTGRLDCGTLDGEVRRWAETCGFDQGEVDSL